MAHKKGDRGFCHTIRRHFQRPLILQQGFGSASMHRPQTQVKSFLYYFMKSGCEAYLRRKKGGLVL
jgi:hypothetical protein